MSSFFAAIFLLGLCLGNAFNFTTVYEWDKFDLIWPSAADSSIEENKRDFIAKNVDLRYMAVFGERLFLSLYLNNDIPATLVWLPTSGTSTAPPKLAPFPSLDLHKKDNCDSIQQAKGLETDPDGRLWVLDDGNKKCPSKIWIFNLLKNDTIEHVYQFPAAVSQSYIGRELREIVLDKTPDDYFAYITAYYSEHIMVYSRKTDKSWSVKIKDAIWWEALALSPKREGRRLYLGTFVYNQLFSVSVSELRKQGGGSGSAAVKSIGVTTGAAYRMLIDSANVLYAGLRFRNDLFKWNISEPYRNEILYEHDMQGAFWPLTFALDANGILWMTRRIETGSGNRYKLLKAAVGARKYLFGTPTGLPSRG